MDWPSSVYAMVLMASALFTGTASYFSYRRRHAPGGNAISILLAAQTWWTICYLLHHSFAVRPEPLFWLKMMFVGVVVVPTSYLVFVLNYINRGRPAKRATLKKLAVVPLLTILVLWTDPYHGWFFAGFGAVPDEWMTGGTGYWLHVVYSYGVVAAGTLLLFHSTLGADSLYRRQTLLLLFGTLAPTVANVTTVFQLVPAPHLDLTPLGFAVTGAIMLYNQYTHGLLDVIPVARSLAVERMSDGLLLLDAEHRVLDVNPAAKRLLGMNEGLRPGMPGSTVIPHYQILAPLLRQRGEVQSEIRLNVTDLEYLDVRVLDLHQDNLGAPGRLVVLRDITPIKRIEADLRAQLAANEKLQDRLQEQAIRDPLTGLYNRRFLEETLVRELARAERAASALGMVVIDLDHFKHINDRYGHGVGDSLLMEFAAMLRSGDRLSDAICRYGGEEFVIVMPGAAPEHALRRADEWRRRFEAVCVTSGQESVSTTFSAGVACYPAHGGDGEQLFKAADRALYAAKAAGRNRVLLAEPVAAMQPDIST